jgi:hypothetical protein
MPSLVEPKLVAAEEAVVARRPALVERAVVVGGLPGCGKTMLTPILGSLARVEIQKFNYALEHMCALDLLGKIPRDAAVTMIRMQTDLDLYNLMMAREVNWRWSDLSSVFQNPSPWRYLRRLAGAGDAAALERARQERPILHLTVHNALAISPLLFEALGERLRVVEVLRHPLYMLKQWVAYIDRYGAEPREFTICLETADGPVPFFARGWEARYLRAAPMDRAIYAIEHLLGMGEGVLEGLTLAQREQVVIVPFEPFVLDPVPWLARLEALLETTQTAATRRELRKQRVPRRRIADGVGKAIYKQYGWQPAAGTDERTELAARRQFAAERATPPALDVLDRLSRDYEARYGGGWLAA